MARSLNEPKRQGNKRSSGSGGWSRGLNKTLKKKEGGRQYRGLHEIQG